jgi:hypothetical protein
MAEALSDADHVDDLGERYRRETEILKLAPDLLPGIFEKAQGSIESTLWY